MTTQTAPAIELARDISAYTPLIGIPAAIVIAFSDSSPNTASTTFRYAFFYGLLGPAAFNMLVLAVLGYIGNNDSVAEAKIVSTGALVALTPGALALPSDYWIVYVLLGLFATSRLLVELRLRTIRSTRVMAVAAAANNAFADDGEADSANTSPSMMFPAERAAHTLDDLAGMDEMKANLLAAAREAAVIVRRGKQKGMQADSRNGILMHGEPGNGKTVIAEGLAGTMKLPIIKMSFGSVASKFVNNTTENVVTMFREARAQAPCVLFLDEVDSVITSRDFSASMSEEGPKVTNQILTELVNTRGTGVVVVMATNFLDRLDTAAIREGRVDFKVLVPPPDAAARRAIMQKALSGRDRKVACEPGAMDQAVKRWEGFSASRIRSVVDEAARRAIKRRANTLTYDDLQEAMRVMQGSLGERLSEDTPKLADLHMPETQKRALLGVAGRMIDIEEIEEMGGTVPNGLLLAGPPGTGKTLTIRALAKTTGWPLLATKGGDLMGDAKAVDELVRKARNARPCIVFIDEADDVFADRRTQSTFAASITNKLLTAMDGAGSRVHDILWAAAVNAPETMDPAALRGGRFTEKVWFENPDADTAERIIGQWLAKSRAKFDASLTPAALATALDGESPANIQAILQQAVNTMIARTMQDNGERIVRPADIEASMGTVLGNA